MPRTFTHQTMPIHLSTFSWIRMDWLTLRTVWFHEVRSIIRQSCCLLWSQVESPLPLSSLVLQSQLFHHCQTSLGKTGATALLPGPLYAPSHCSNLGNMVELGVKLQFSSLIHNSHKEQFNAGLCFSLSWEVPSLGTISAAFLFCCAFFLPFFF